MSEQYSSKEVIDAISAASSALDARKDDINKLNVFPVPDGDTGTNMSLTMQSVVSNIAALPPNSSPSQYRKAIITGALMGARGNSGVITSQILRGLCEGSEGFGVLNTECVSAAFERAVEVAFQAVRKPVPGTILTVLEDCAKAAKSSLGANLSIDDALNAIVDEAFASVERTPDALPILKENGVVDAGGFGLAILFEGFSSYLQGDSRKTGIQSVLFGGNAAHKWENPKVAIEQVDDWEGSEYRYCNEFLVDSNTLNAQEALDFLSTLGDCELCVGSAPKFKVHVHSNSPDKVLAYFLERGQISEVFIHNMDLQSKERIRKISSDESSNNENVSGSGANANTDSVSMKSIGVVAVAVGHGNAEIFSSLGVDVVVEGGQTMNPSTKDLLGAINSVPADNVIVLPDNSNIVMAAESACGLSKKNCAVVATKSVPEGISAMFAFDEDASIEENVSSMKDALSCVHTGEVTTAVKPSKDCCGNPICEGDVIGLADGEIKVVGNCVDDVMLGLLDVMDASSFDNLMMLGGSDVSKETLDELVSKAEDVYFDLDIDAHLGGQPLYPIIFSLE